MIFRDRPVHVAGWAKRFQFEPAQLDSKVSELSGGEKARVLMARLMLRKADLLVLDEPTNDLDLPTLEILEESLESFEGAVLIVSHDRFLMSRLCDSFLGLDGQGGVLAYASYEQWEKQLTEQNSRKEERKEKKDGKVKNSQASAIKLSYSEQREFDSMEKKILEIEHRLVAIDEELTLPENLSQASKLASLAEEGAALRAELDRLFERWGELESKKP